ncbi:MAG: hypothetical protein NTX75_15000 [Proteobacteria bacterium]|nr:hypothetical protein [Pseudomonadota bacterium]
MGTAFIIMQIGNPELDKVCVEAMVPALKACGLDPKRVDKHNKGGLLKSEIIQFIQTSEIILADLTNERPNCYLEIGYAMGIDKLRNLILTVREDHFPENPAFVQGGPKVHFDLAGYDILSWKKDELDVFRQELEKRIRRRLAVLEPKEEKRPSVWDEEWLAKNREAALTGLTKSKLPGGREICFALHPPNSVWGPQELNEAARRSVIKTTGWPIGVYLENREEFRPRPRADGIVAEIAIEDRSSYDYWAIKRNGDFYSLSSLLEDRLTPTHLYLDTNVIRTTEGLLYCARLYARLGVDPSSKVQFSLRFTGLKDRILTTTRGENPFPDHRCIEDEIVSEVSTSLQEIEAKTVALIKQLLSPVFILFDFFELSDSVYDDLVNKFVQGKM